MSSEYLHQDDKVRVLTDLYDSNTSLPSVTANSLGKIISFDEYCDYIEREFNGKDTLAERAKHFSKVAKEIQDGKLFVVKVESFAPFSHTINKYVSQTSFLEDVVLISPQYLEKIE